MALSQATEAVAADMSSLSLSQLDRLAHEQTHPNGQNLKPFKASNVTMSEINNPPFQQIHILDYYILLNTSLFLDIQSLNFCICDVSGGNVYAWAIVC